jgi:hypothetical protein
MGSLPEFWLLTLAKKGTCENYNFKIIVTSYVRDQKCYRVRFRSLWPGHSRVTTGSVGGNPRVEMSHVRTIGIQFGNMVKWTANGAIYDSVFLSASIRSHWVTSWRFNQTSPCSDPIISCKTSQTWYGTYGHAALNSKISEAQTTPCFV